MPRFLLSPRWIGFHLLVITAVVVMVNLGFWQLNRLDERRGDNDRIELQRAQPAVSLTDLLDAQPADYDPADLANRAVTATGTYAADQIVLFNRSQNGRAVDNVLTPLLLADGRTVLVNRGAIAVEATPPAPPAVAVEVFGRVRPTEVRERGGLTDSAQDVIREVRRVDIARIAPQLPGEVVPVYLELVDSRPEVTVADPEVLIPPQLTEGNHLSYAVQWFIFAFCVVVGWVLAVTRSLRTRRVSDAAATA